MLSLGKEGLAVADEQGSGFGRKSNIFQKLRPLNDSSVYGGSGSADFIMEVYQIVSDQIKKIAGEVSLRDIYKSTNEALIYQINLLKDNALRAGLGISLEEHITGYHVQSGRPLGDIIKSNAEELIKKFDGMCSARISIGGIENGRFSIYEVDDSGIGMKTSLPYSSIGSGADESSKLLASYVEGLPREKRDKIDQNEGLAKLIEATNSSARTNVGVGGTISIVHITKDQIKMTDEGECRLASEIVEGLTFGLIKRKVAYDMLNSLIFNGGNVNDIENRMKDESKNWNKLDRRLRGYRE